MNAEGLQKANEQLKTIDVKGKNYVQVNERVKAFRMICPNGCISSEIVSLEDGVVTMKATVTDEDGKILGTGFAQEKETSSFINKTSFIENCETSAVGRALGFAGIGIDGSMASADEVANAMLNQTKNEYINKKEQTILRNMIEKRGLNVDNVLNGTPIEKVTVEMYMDATKRLSKLPEVKA
ncbi:MAG: hypothetical protein IIY21_18215 [Clostridiales bacterium]|nr:hypothetical protein [Clostridiales bacterium]MBQ1571944.1 hypothetical protein [Clostridiales bacterium]